MLKSIVAIVLSVFTSFNILSQTVKQEDVYAQRLATLRSPLDLTYNAEVKRYIDQYLDNPEKTKELITLSKVYFPTIERALRAKNLPTDLKYIAMAVSELNPLAENSYGASGQWMMMYTVSKMYKLKVNSFVDERKDPNKSAIAAASHFKDLYSIYKQWPLAIASYGCSPVMLNKCIRMANNSLYFWDVYPYIPENSRGLFPKVIATAYILNYYKEHNIKPNNQDAPFTPELDSALVNKWLSFQQISATIHIPLEQLRKLNPTFKKDIIPYTPEGYWIYLPKSKGAEFDLLRDSLYSPLPKTTEFVPVAIQKPGNDTLPQTDSIPTVKSAKTPSKPTVKKAKVYYVVKKGDNLTAIADWFDVTEADIKKWNKLNGNKLPKGKKLQLFVDKTKTGYYKRINTMSPAQKKKLRQKD
ncbi:MAG: transglycosylase SLT domain-containing protein [Bacteroidia bacterium]|jgi:membrane-bound lytic murein transglycosylase D|nr:transglycosylase SLT domain-containing protein [Bacteroidia bacterium]